MRELNPDGSLRNAEDLLKDQGFVIDTFVRRKADKLECQIKHIGGNQVQLEELHKKGLMKVSSDQFLSGKWHVFTPRKDVEVLQDLVRFRLLSVHRVSSCSHGGGDPQGAGDLAAEARC